MQINYANEISKKAKKFEILPIKANNFNVIHQEKNWKTKKLQQ